VHSIDVIPGYWNSTYTWQWSTGSTYDFGRGPKTADTSGWALDTFAVWSPVPEPSTALLMTVGLLALASRGRREAWIGSV